jgi:arylsulfatase A-like enzyme
VEFLQGQLAYTDVLAAGGYVCGISGKWHMGDSFKPQKSFSHWYVHTKGGSAYHDAPMIRDGVLVEEPGYLTEVITDDALNYLRQQANGEQPFYLSVHYTAPHSPWINQHPQEIVDSYDDCPFESCPEEPPHPWAFKTSPGPENRKENLKGYFAAITAMDGQVGLILDLVEELGLAENTLICFMGDNGENCGHHGIWGKGNGTFPQNMYDTSVKVPAIFSQPGRVAQGVVCEELLSQYDFMPTLLEHVGLDNPVADGLPGRSFAALLGGAESAGVAVGGDGSGDGRDSVVVFDEYGPVRMIRSKTWKYVHRYPYGPHELYDLIGDPGERTNLVDAPEHREVKEAMKAKLEEWYVRYVDPRVDGVREPVTGKGQMALAGPAGKGVKAFVDKGRQ